MPEINELDFVAKTKAVTSMGSSIKALLKVPQIFKNIFEMLKKVFMDIKDMITEIKDSIGELVENVIKCF